MVLYQAAEKRSLCTSKFSVRTFQFRFSLFNNLLDVTEDARDTLGELRPAFFFLRQLLPPFGRDRIETRLAIPLGEAPFGSEPALLLHAMERGIEGSFFDPE